MPGPVGGSSPGSYRPTTSGGPSVGVPSAPSVPRPEVPLAGPAPMAPGVSGPSVDQTLPPPGQPAYAQPAQGPPPTPAAIPGGSAGYGVPSSGPAQTPYGAAYPEAAAPIGTAPMAAPVQPYQGLPPSGPPPVPPPSNAPAPSAQTPQQPQWNPQEPAGPVGAAVHQQAGGTPNLPKAKARTARSMRRESRAQSSYFALMFLMCAAIFLVGVVIVLIISLAT